MGLLDLVWKQVNKNYRLIKHHIGAPGNVDGEMPHPAADEINAGFMTPAQVDKLKYSTGEYKILQDGTDVAKLGPGNYYIVGSPTRPGGAATLTNAFFYEVKQTGAFKSIEAVLAYNGKKYWLSTWGDKPNNGSDGWRKEIHEVTLFSGYMSSGYLTLPIDIDEFDGLRFEYKFEGDTICTSDVFQLKKASKYQLTAKYLTGDDAWARLGFMRLSFSSQYTFNIDSNVTLTTDFKGTVNKTSGTIAIARIIGLIGGQP